MKRLFTALLLGAASGLAAAPTAKSGPLSATGGWVWAVAPGQPDTSAFMTLKNTGKVAVRVTGGSTALAGMVMPMKTTASQHGAAHMSGMQNVAALVVPPGGSLTLKPDGDHLMLMGLKRALKPGETITLSLNTSAGLLKVPLTVRKP